MQWKIKNGLSFEKSGRVSDYLTYCRSSIGKYADMRPTARKKWNDLWGRLAF